MPNFFDRFKPDAAKKSNKGIQNPFANMRLPGQNFSGSGNSLGGTQPGKVIDIQLENAGPLGVQVERRPNSQGTAIVAKVVDGSQAAAAGIQRGDILCFAGSNGTEEIMYEMFLELAKSDQRPLCFQVRRVTSKAGASAAAAAAGGVSSNHNNAKGAPKGSSSAEAYARKQAVIAAAEKREKAAKSKLKPMSRVSKTPLPALLSTADRNRLEEERLARATQMSKEEPKSDQARQAIQQAKDREVANAAQLGYNPYETNRATAGQARTATVAQQHGTMQNDGAEKESGGRGGGSGSGPSPAVVLPPVNALEAAATDAVQPNTYFMESFETVVTSNEHAVAVSSMSIMRKLICNATTKGQSVSDPVAAAKFRRVRLANTKIKAAIVDVPGALDVMLSTGFQLAEEEGESVLVFPPDATMEDWLPTALRQMESYEKS